MGIPQPASDGAWLAPAKLNLMLRVLGRRPDGYHRLQTVFQFVDQCDRLFFEPRADGGIERLGGPPEIPPEQDLVVRAARALQEETGCDAGVDIRLEKHLPMGGGLGGGSSDAATTLHALNRLWGTALATERLAEIGLRLGADVPVFVRGDAAWGEGVGESLVPVELPMPWYLVLIPPCQVSTAAVFGDPGLTRDSAPITLGDFLRGNANNDCLATVLANYPVVANAYRWLAERAEAKLTGTGACLFAALPDRAAAEQLLSEVAPEIPAFVARGRNRSPLFASLYGEGSGPTG
ncbi:4-(cytidine 5'-diphospho)-2-C-methyl-D-erythritol kinase [Halochromatium salexigens]|uniref:4-diphosphocytidyl-2-C-methyl-D-erythritol kinase n=1 Tax=Halochromatium salexigens TaxID=49447 RepID=A0AAJ0UF96_HALSE|nr:4-(cytidine 5'-diphospho)-2-C-methyl-D-erythritol kinase [Halochromatium salexigens]MBK5930378.1 4-(cytidine 5'-diphospho)-2-C-methyl-D-erythritol kinase [Halochromatium salexigens]